MYNEMHVRFISKLENVTLARSLSVAFLVDLNLNLNTMNEIKTIVSEAVTNAIKTGRVGGFATDVYSVEPFGENHPFNEILNYPNVLLTPHMAWGAYEARKRCLDEIIENIKAFYNGDIRCRVDLL